MLRNFSSMPVDRDTSHLSVLMRSEPVNMPKTIEPPAKCAVRAVIRFLYSEKATRNVVLRYCPSPWQYSAAHCSCNKQTPEAFVHSPSSARTRMKRSKEDYILAQLATDQCRELAESTGGWLLWQGYWKVGTTLWNICTSKRRLCKEIADRCC